MRIRALRGAIKVEGDEKEEIIESTREVLEGLLERNGVDSDDIITVIFTATDDLHSEFPAVAMRRMGLSHIPCLCARELDIKGALTECVRVLMFVYTDKDKNQLRHVYLREARQLRMDLPE